MVCVFFVRLFVLRVLVGVSFVFLPLAIRDWLRLVIVALPGLFLLPFHRAYKLNLREILLNLEFTYK